MKKLFFLALILIANLSLLHAQRDRDSKWMLTAVPVVALPIKFLQDFHSFGVGADIAAIHPVGDEGWAVGGRANYTYFFGKQTPNAGGTGISSHYDATHILNILGDVSYRFPSNFIIGLDLGLGTSLTHATADASFARVLYGAYETNGGHPINFALYFDQTNFQKNIGFRVGFRI